MTINDFFLRNTDCTQRPNSFILDTASTLAVYMEKQQNNCAWNFLFKQIKTGDTVLFSNAYIYMFTSCYSFRRSVLWSTCIAKMNLSGLPYASVSLETTAYSASLTSASTSTIPVVESLPVK